MFHIVNLLRRIRDYRADRAIKAEMDECDDRTMRILEQIMQEEKASGKSLTEVEVREELLRRHLAEGIIGARPADSVRRSFRLKH